MAFKSRWPEALRSACLVDILDRQSTARAAHDRAVRGVLPEQLEPFPDLPLKTVMDWARVERARRGQQAAAAVGPVALLTGHAHRLAAILDRETRRMERARGAVDPKRVAEMARAGIELAKLARAIDGDAQRPPADAGKTAAPAGFLDALAQDPDA